MDIIQTGKKVLQTEANALTRLLSSVNQNFVEAVEALNQCQGRVVVTGMGKSGIIGKKISATLASTGAPSFFLHPAEGLHGDIGMISKGDVILAISNSGETEELLKILPSIKRLGLFLLSMTGNIKSTLARESDVALDVSVQEEAGAMGIVPTASTTAALAMGDALAVALFELRGIKEEDFAFFHPGGSLGRRLLLRVKDIMHQTAQIPIVSEESSLKEALFEMTRKKMGMTTVTGRQGKLTGVITDGDLRRLLEKEEKIFEKRAKEVMTKNPKFIGEKELAAKAVQVMETYSITVLPVMDENEKLVGVVHLHDLLKMGVV
ncbi:MAG: KpsF/GutQ family sugar-phosphate isomerase [Nitrospirae bacterium]|nr:KpsF/GutQ family sugar-phosphate isomerase [Nitrospirota bacterium]MBI3353041.1 KpsF/GutQ family sugar-phosphate isomerase [Nitrospirota bacterium]